MWRDCSDCILSGLIDIADQWLTGEGFYDLAFMELSLPLMSGREAVAELSKSPDMMLPVIAIANDADAAGVSMMVAAVMEQRVLLFVKSVCKECCCCAGLQQDGFAGVICETSGTHELLKVHCQTLSL